MSRVDFSTGSVLATVRLPGEPGNIVVAGGGVWVNVENVGVDEIDPSTNQVTHTVKIPQVVFESLVSQGNTLIAGSRHPDALHLISATTHSIVRTVRAPSVPFWIVGGPSGTFVSFQYGTEIDQINPQTLSLKSVGTGLPGCIDRMAEQGTVLWFTTCSPRSGGGTKLWRMDLRSHVFHPYSMPFDSYGIASDGTHLFVVSTWNQIAELDGSTGALLATFTLSQNSWGIAHSGTRFAALAIFGNQVDLFTDD